MGGTIEVDSAKELWKKIGHSLSDRGCFNGVDDEVMEEIRGDLTALIRGTLSKEDRKAG